ncbi:MAG: type II toxin-antitoxin system VapC family toxin [Treponema sp.]|nr:type II toxin-antitoxin system VapC family toxin [Treponema sp.]
MIYVFDSSFVGSLIIPDEKKLRIDKMYSSIKNEDERHSPDLIWYEVANIFKNLIRRKRYSYEEILTFFPLMAALRLISDNETGVKYTEKLLRLCNDYNLSSYDAAYLELAGRKKAVLCTLDENLLAAAKKHGVAVIK